MNASESGSMFSQLLPTLKIMALTASNSGSVYCYPEDIVESKHIGSCLASYFNVLFLNDLDDGKSTIIQD